MHSKNSTAFRVHSRTFEPHSCDRPVHFFSLPKRILRAVTASSKIRNIQILRRRIKTASHFKSLPECPELAGLWPRLHTLIAQESFRWFIEVQLEFFKCRHLLIAQVSGLVLLVGTSRYGPRHESGLPITETADRISRNILNTLHSASRILSGKFEIDTRIWHKIVWKFTVHQASWFVLDSCYSESVTGVSGLRTLQDLVVVSTLRLTSSRASRHFAHYYRTEFGWSSATGACALYTFP